MMKNNRLFFMILSLFCFIAAGICFIVDLAINQRITWAAYSLLSTAFFWAVVSPLFIKKHGIILLLSSFTLLLLPYLFCLSHITPVTDWFVPVGLPAAIAGITALWILYPLLRYAKIGIWYKTAIAVFLLCAVIAPAIDYFVDIYLGDNPFSINRIVSFFAGIAAAAVFGILGYVKKTPVKDK